MFYACRLFLSCLRGLLFVVVGCLVRLPWFLCAVWAVFDVPGCRRLLAPLGIFRLVVGGGVRVFISGGFVCLWILRGLGGVLWSF